MIGEKARELAAKANKKYGDGTVVLGSDIQNYERIPTGSLSLDVVLGGGWAANAWHEVYGDESAGKSNLCFATIAANQQRDPDFTTVWVAAEEMYRPWAEAAGVDMSQVLVVETNVAEEAYEAVLQFAESREVDLIVIDSLPALVPTLEDGKDVGELSPGRMAYLTNQFFRKGSKHMKRSLLEKERPITGLIINQFRMKIGVQFGDPRTVPGGKGKNFWYYTRLELYKDDWIEVSTPKGKDRIGQTIRAKTVKCKSAPRERTAYYDLYFDVGGPVEPGRIDYAKEIVNLATFFGIVDRAGAWYRYAGQQWQGTSNFAAAIREDLDLQEQLEREVLRHARREVE